jgi:hypothetical protein
MSISISVSANAPFKFPANIINDSFPPVDEESSPGADIPSVYANLDIDFNIKFSYSKTAGEGEESISVAAPIVEIKSVGALPFDGSTVEVVDNETIRIAGRSTGFFIDEIFRFLFADKTELNLKPDNTDNWTAIVKWAAPGKIEELATFTFEVFYGSASGSGITIQPGSEIVNLTQFVYWDFNPSLNIFGSLVAESAERLKQPRE